MINFREWVPQWLAAGMILFSVLVIQSVSGMYGVIFQHIVLSNGLDTYDSSVNSWQTVFLSIKPNWWTLWALSFY